jgi:hypothetical protein
LDLGEETIGVSSSGLVSGSDLWAGNPDDEEEGPRDWTHGINASSGRMWKYLVSL